MPNNQFSSEIKNEAFEEEIKDIASEVKVFQERHRDKEWGDREALKRTIQSMSSNRDTSPIASDDDEVNDDSILPNYMSEAPESARLEVESLVEKAMREGIEKAVKEASGSSPYILDAFHDALTGKLYEELKKRGLLK